MTKRRSNMHSQAPSPLRTNTGDNSIEEIGNHTCKISEMIASKVKKQLQKGIEEIRSEINSEVNKKETIPIIKEVLSASKDNDKNRGQ